MTRDEKLAHAASAVLSLLPTDDRAVLERRLGLHDGHIHTHKDIAEDLGMTMQGVKDAETRALDRLRDNVPADEARKLLAV